MTTELIDLLTRYKKVMHFDNSSIRRQRLETEIVRHLEPIVNSMAIKFASREFNNSIPQEDFTQEAWKVLFREIIPATNEEIRSIPNYTNAVLYKRLTDYVRRQNHYRTEKVNSNGDKKIYDTGVKIVNAEYDCNKPAEIKAPEDMGLAKHILKGISALLDKMIFLLYYKYQYLDGEIAIITGVTKCTITRRRAVLQKMLRQALS